MPTILSEILKIRQKMETDKSIDDKMKHFDEILVKLVSKIEKFK